MRKSKGYTLIEGLLVLIIVVALGGVAWYVLKANDKASDTYISADSANSSTVKYDKQPAVDPTADWVSYSSTEGKYSLKYPKTWVKASNLQLCNPGLLLLGGNESSVGKCATESFGQMNVASADGDSSKEAELATGYTKIVKTTVIVNDVSGVKMTGEASGQQQESEIGTVGLADGTKVTKYIFYTNSRTYTATYIGQNSYPDVTSDFNLVVTKTLKFSS